MTDEQRDKMMAGVNLQPLTALLYGSTLSPKDSPDFNDYDMLGITRHDMTYYERYQAVKAYWGQQRKAGMIKKRAPYPDPSNVTTGCNCDGAGWYIQRTPAGLSEMKKCTCGIAGPSAFERSLNRELDILANRTFENFHLDRPYKETPGASVAMQQAMVTNAVNKARSFANAPSGWLYIHGTVGAGKSHLAAAVANVCGRLHRVIYRSMPAMLDTIRENSQMLDKLFDQISTADVVVLDDIGADGTPTEWAEARIFRLINDRVDKPTVFTSNVDVWDLPYHERIKDRLNASRRAWLNTTSMRGQL